MQKLSGKGMKLVCGVYTKPYKQRPLLLHSTNNHSTYDLRPSSYYSSSRNNQAAQTRESRQPVSQPPVD